MKASTLRTTALAPCQFNVGGQTVDLLSILSQETIDKGIIESGSRADSHLRDVRAYKSGAFWKYDEVLPIGRMHWTFFASGTGSDIVLYDEMPAGQRESDLPSASNGHVDVEWVQNDATYDWKNAETFKNLEAQGKVGRIDYADLSVHWGEVNA